MPAGALIAAALAGSGARVAGDVIVRTARDEAFRGEVASFSLEDGLRLQTADAGVVSVAARDIVYLRQRGEARTPASVHVRLADGSIVAGELLGGAEGMLRVGHAWLGDITLLLDHVKWIRTGAAPEDDPPASDEPAGIDDVIILQNGDRQVGTLLGVREGALWIENDLGESFVPLDVFREVRLATDDTTLSPPAGRLARLRLSDGSRLIAERIAWKDSSLAVRIRGQEATIPAEAVREIDIIGGRWVWLSELTPARVEQTPLWGVDWPARLDRNARGGPLRVDGRRYDRGVGVHSACRLVYRLEGEYEKFLVVPGVDDDAGPLADVTVRIIVDGTVRFEHEHITPGQSPGQLRIDVDGASTLELDVQFGHYGDVQDRFDWADAALVRK